MLFRSAIFANGYPNVLWSRAAREATNVAVQTALRAARPDARPRPAEEASDEPQCSLDSRQSQAAHAHPIGRVQLTWRAATTPTVGIGRMGAAGEEALPSKLAPL